ncbi:MAG: Glycosidase related protein, partial [Candidatus Gottesmanbacteria bacterium GW2011_GWA2_42_18]
YHGLSQTDGQYRVGAALLDFQDIDNVLARLSDPVLEPETNYECSGERPGTVFPCGAILKDGLVYMYYGGADTFTAVATLDFNHLVDELSQRV